MIEHKYIHKVNYYETDRMGISHHSNYIRWMEEARVDFLEKIGWSYAKIESIGIGSPVLKVSCNYKHSTTFNDVVLIKLSIKEYNGIRLKMAYEMYNEKTNDCVAICESEHCFLNSEGRIIKLKNECPDFDEALLKCM